MNKWTYTNYDEIECMNCGFMHKDEVFYLIEGISTDYLPYCPACGHKMAGFCPDGRWIKESDLGGVPYVC